MTILSDKLAQLCEFLAASGGPFAWRGIRIFELGSSHDDRGRPRIQGDQLLLPEEYSGRFDELLACGLPWINLSCYGIHDGLLLVGIELPSSATRVSANTSINYSGPTMAVRSHGWDASQALAIVEQKRP